MKDIRFDAGLYAFPEAARLVRRSQQTLRNWVRGYRYPAGGRLVRARPVIEVTTDDQSVLSFVNLVEALSLSAFREAGVPLQRVRRALEYAAREIDASHLLASQQLLTDGLDLFWRFQEQTGEALVNLSRGGQKAFPEAVAAYLLELEWGKDRFVQRWWPGGRAEGVIVVDPRRGFGAPVVAGTGIRTEDVFSRFSAGESVSDLSEDYGLPTVKMEAAIRFEAGLLEPLAA